MWTAHTDAYNVEGNVEDTALLDRLVANVRKPRTANSTRQLLCGQEILAEHTAMLGPLVDDNDTSRMPSCHSDLGTSSVR